MKHLAYRGFTLVEMLVSLALFTIIATMAVGTLLVLINGNARVVSEQSVLTTLSFALDSMTREIRTGSEYYCGSQAQVTNAAVYNSTTTVRDCTSGDVGLSFREAGKSITGGTGARRIAYYYDASTKQIMRQVNNGSAKPVVNDDVRITEARFNVTGADPLGTGTNKIQPTVTIVLVAEASTTDSVKQYTLETTVTQRSLDL